MKFGPLITRLEQEKLRIMTEYRKKLDNLDAAINGVRLLMEPETAENGVAKRPRKPRDSHKTGRRGQVFTFKCQTCGKEKSLAWGEYCARKKQSGGVDPKYCSRACVKRPKEERSAIREKAKENEEEFKRKMNESILAKRPIRSFKDMTPEERAAMEAQYKPPVQAAENP